MNVTCHTPGCRRQIPVPAGEATTMGPFQIVKLCPQHTRECIARHKAEAAQ